MGFSAVNILENGFDTVISAIGDFTSDFSTAQIATATALGGVAVGAGVMGVVSAIKRKSVKRKSKITRVRKAARKKKLTPLMRRRRKIIARKGRQTPYTARGGRDTSTRRIRHTKKGQPYVILASGKARFISKASAKRSRKMKGGRY